LRQRASYSESQTTSPALSGLALVAVLLAVFVGLGSRPSSAGAATLEPCEATQPTGPTVDLEGELNLSPVKATKKAWKRSGIRQKLVKPANNLTGRPAFPVKAVKYDSVARVDLKGGLRLERGRRWLTIRGLAVYSAAGKPAMLRGTIGGKTVNLFKVQGGKRTFDPGTGELSRVGTARLTAAGAKLLNGRLGIGKRKKLRAGISWGYFNLYSLYKVTESEDPTIEVPNVPPDKTEPQEAQNVTSAATIKWYVRESFINYVASGEGTRVEDGATADAPSGSNNLTYSFNFPFDTGWTVPEALDSSENTVIKGTGLVGFRYCHNTINFAVSNPEVEIDGDENSRLIFVTNGTDGTPFPDQRVVMVKLIPSRAESHTVVDNGNGFSTVTYEKIPGYVPADGSGIFAGFYPGYSTSFDGQPQDERPDRFGYFSIVYTFPNADH
jgi:hypothetical protein